MLRAPCAFKLKLNVMKFEESKKAKVHPSSAAHHNQQQRHQRQTVVSLLKLFSAFFSLLVTAQVSPCFVNGAKGVLSDTSTHVAINATHTTKPRRGKWVNVRASIEEVRHSTENYSGFAFLVFSLYFSFLLFRCFLCCFLFMFYTFYIFA